MTIEEMNRIFEVHNPKLESVLGRGVGHPLGGARPLSYKVISYKCVAILNYVVANPPFIIAPSR